MQLNTVTARFMILSRFRERLKSFGHKSLFLLMQTEAFVAVDIVEDPSDI